MSLSWSQTDLTISDRHEIDITSVSDSRIHRWLDSCTEFSVRLIFFHHVRILGIFVDRSFAMIGKIIFAKARMSILSPFEEIDFSWNWGHVRPIVIVRGQMRSTYADRCEKACQRLKWILHIHVDHRYLSDPNRFSNVWPLEGCHLTWNDLMWPFVYQTYILPVKIEKFRIPQLKISILNSVKSHRFSSYDHGDGFYWPLAISQSEECSWKPTWVKLWIPFFRFLSSKILLEHEFSKHNRIDIAIDLEVFAKNQPLRNSGHHI